MARKNKAKHIRDLAQPAPAYREPKPTMELSGADAKALFGKKPGTKVKFSGSGTLVDTGIDRYTSDKRPRATIEINKAKVGR